MNEIGEGTAVLVEWPDGTKARGTLEEILHERPLVATFSLYFEGEDPLDSGTFELEQQPDTTWRNTETDNNEVLRVYFNLDG